MSDGVDESEKRRIDLIRRLAEMPDDDEPHPDWILTEEEGRQLLDILRADKDEGKE